MGIGTLCQYLIGDRQAILALASSRHALWVGLVFVLSAGLAREYDGEYLLAEPWHLLLPLAASLGSSFVLFFVAYWQAVTTGERPGPFYPRYASFLGLFWLTAPLAWMYAVPYERFLGPADAVGANLMTLGLVALWRVALMVRVLMVLLNYPLLKALGVVLGFADGVALVLLIFLPFPLITLMGGLRLGEGERVLFNAGGWVFCLGLTTGPVWLVLALTNRGGRELRWQPAEDSPGPDARPSEGLSALALAAVLVWLPVLPFTQAEQRLRYEVEQAVRDGRMTEALAVLSGHRPDEFPPHWEPPPRRFSRWGGEHEQLLGIVEAFEAAQPAPWVREVYLGKFREELPTLAVLAVGPDPSRVAGLLARLPEGETLLRELEREDAYRGKELRSAVREFKRRGGRPGASGSGRGPR